MKCEICKESWYCDGETWDGKISDETMAPCTKAYREDDGNWYVDITSMDQLKDLIKEVKEDIIISINEPNVVGNDHLHIKVYDNYIE